MSPTQRTLALLKRLGHPAAVVERWNPHARVRQDLFGCIDILALAHGHTWAIQCTSAAHVADRQAKLEQNPLLPAMQAAGWTILVQGWRKPTQTRRRWTCLTRKFMFSTTYGSHNLTASGGWAVWMDVELEPARRPQDPAPGSAPDTGPGGVRPPRKWTPAHKITARL